MTVYAYKHHVLRRAGVRDHFDFCRLSGRHRDLWRYLNRLGARGLDRYPVPPDIDAATEMSDDEIAEGERMLEAALAPGLGHRVARAVRQRLRRWRLYWRAQARGTWAVLRGDFCITSDMALCPRCDRWLDPVNDWIMHLCAPGEPRPAILCMRQGRYLRAMFAALDGTLRTCEPEPLTTDDAPRIEGRQTDRPGAQGGMDDRAAEEGQGQGPMTAPRRIRQALRALDAAIQRGEVHPTQAEAAAVATLRDWVARCVQRGPTRRQRHEASVLTALALEAQCAEFNRRAPVGTSVRYWPFVRDGEGIVSRVESAAVVLAGHTPVVFLEGRADCIALSHVEVLS